MVHGRAAGARTRLLAGAALVNLCLGSLFSWSLFVAPLQDEFGASGAALSGVFSAAVATFALVVLAAGRTVDRAAPRTTVMAAALCALGGMLLAARAGTLWTVAAGYGVLFGIGNGLGYATAVAAAGKAFAERRGLAVGVTVGAYAAGPLVASPLISALLDAHGWRVTFAALGAGIATLMACGALLLGGRRQAVPGTGPTAAAGRRLRLRSRAVALLGGAFLLGTLPPLMVVAHAAAIAGERGLDAAAVTAAVALLGAGNLTGRTAGGWLSDRLGRLPGLGGAALTLVLACLALPAVTGTAAVLITLALVGIGYGTQSALLPSLTADLFGARHFGANYGRVFLGWGFAGLLGPQVGARLAAAAGGYDAALRVGAASAGLALLLYVTIARAARRAQDGPPRAGRSPRPRRG